MTNESDASKTPRATVTIDQHVADAVIPVLDETDFFGLGKNSITRANLMLYAMAVGWDNRLKASFAKSLSGGFARTESFSDYLSTVVRVAHFATVGFDNPDELRDINSSFALLEQYANGGFQLIEGEILDKMETEEKANLVIADLNKRYEKIFGKGSDY